MVTFVPASSRRTAAPAPAADRASCDGCSRRTRTTPAAVEGRLDEWQKANPVPRATLAMVADHIDHIRKVAGIDHIGIGGDFDGIESAPVGLEDVSKYPALTAELLRRGYSDEDVKKVLGLNVLRVMREAEAVARRLQKERAPSTARIEDLDK